jgi:hypothetical protein
MFQELEGNQTRQYIDAEQTRKAWLAALTRSNSFRGSMYWQTKNGSDYLTREYSHSGIRQFQSLGVRSVETEHILNEFKKGRELSSQTVKSLTDEMQRHVRVNVAMRVGRTPSVVVNILESLRKSGISEHFMVIGTNALYAYETCAGVRFSGDLTATTDMDLLWDSRKRLTLVSGSHDEAFKTGGLLAILKKVDATFSLVADEEYRAVNGKGYYVDLIKRRPKSLFDDKEPQQLIKNSDDFWAAKITNIDWILSAPKFRQVVVAENGNMAEMIAPDPRAFALYKTWLSQKDDRDPMKKPRDSRQAKAVIHLIDDRFPHLAFKDIHVFPSRINQMINSGD